MNKQQQDRWNKAIDEAFAPHLTGTGRSVRLTHDQRKALKAYEFRLREEDRYLGSVFVDPVGQRAIEARTREAYERCLALGMTHEHGL